MGRLPAAAAPPPNHRIERERVLLEARKLVPGPTGDPTANPALLEAAFSPHLTRLGTQHGAGRRSLLIYRQTLLVGLKAAARWPTNLATIYDFRQGKEESPAAFLERLQDEFRRYTHYDPEAPAAVRQLL